MIYFFFVLLFLKVEMGGSSSKIECKEHAVSQTKRIGEEDERHIHRYHHSALIQVEDTPENPVNTRFEMFRLTINYKYKEEGDDAYGDYELYLLNNQLQPDSGPRLINAIFANQGSREFLENLVKRAEFNRAVITDFYWKVIPDMYDAVATTTYNPFNPRLEMFALFNAELMRRFPYLQQHRISVERFVTDGLPQTYAALFYLDIQARLTCFRFLDLTVDAV
jgi:hypothetical protein